LLAEKVNRQEVISKLKAFNIQSVFHYIPLHSSPFGSVCSKVYGVMDNTNKKSAQLLRLPLWLGLNSESQYIVFEKLSDALGC
jgi:dTDP-4-amino-4,6-dideoxygalactose transaminase